MSWGWGSGIPGEGNPGPIMLMDTAPFSPILKGKDTITLPGPDSEAGLIEFGPVQYVSLGEKILLAGLVITGATVA